MLFYRVVQHPVATRLEQEYKEKVAAATAALNPRMNNPDDDEDDLPEPEATTSTTTTDAAPVVLRRSTRKRAAPPEFETGQDWARAKTTMPSPLVDFLFDELQENCFPDKVVWTKDFIRNVLETEAFKESARVGKFPKNIITAHGKELMAKATTTTCTTRSKKRWMARQADWMSQQADWVVTFVKIALNEALLMHAPSSCSSSSSSSSSLVDDLEGGADAIRVQLQRLFKNLSEIFDKQDSLGPLKSYLVEVLSSTTFTTKTIATSASTLTGTDEKRVAVVEPEEEMALL
jgi:hypothetical protein